MKNVIKVGLVDDHQLFREGLRMMIESSPDMEVCLEASNGEELLAKLKEGTIPEVILLDLEMPNMDGMKTSEQLHAFFPEIKFLILTMHEDSRLIQHMMKQGANGYVLKTAKWEELRQAIEQVIAKDYYFSDLVGLAMLKNLHQPRKSKPQIHDSFHLSKREYEVLELICKGHTTTEIGELLFISPRTVEGHRTNLLKRLEVKNTAGLIIKALKNNLLSLSQL